MKSGLPHINAEMTPSATQTSYVKETSYIYASKRVFPRYTQGFFFLSFSVVGNKWTQNLTSSQIWIQRLLGRILLRYCEGSNPTKDLNFKISLMMFSRNS